ncbi:MAG TPA: glycosyltransferase [Bacteroidales bacterium]
MRQISAGFFQTKMKIIHIIPSIDLTCGGPSKSVSDLAINQANQGIDVTIFTKASENPYLRESPNPNLHLVFVNNSSFKQALLKILDYEKIDLLHGHGLWEMPVHIMGQLAKRRNIPTIITPRGMLEPWALNASKWKKKLALYLYQRKDLANVNCIHVTAQMEANNIRKLGFSKPIAVIPNGIDIKEFNYSTGKLIKENKTILFLSRIHPKKGIEILIDAWSLIDEKFRKNWQIKIAGNGEEKYVTYLQNLIIEKELVGEVSIIGPQFGSAKLAAYNQADLFVLPTYSENFGVVVAEALACGIPAITTKGAPWEDLELYNAGWWIESGVQPLVETLKIAMKLSESEREQMGLNGKKLIKENYSIHSVASQMIELYKWILIKKEKPEFIC